ncbi:MAG TPA: hypothetical protein VJY62_12535 [Bacteroidia bacterium]|nr:hypothetical protein [Bacteroidia bacterium]
MAGFDFPYPGFSWSITQHVAPATNVRTLFEFLKAAHFFSASPNYQRAITDYMIKQNLLTANVRKDQGEPQLWRDYQQILPELGLIVSTRFTKKIIVTPMGLLWLDGAIGYSEMMTTQCVNFQYPNGHKQDISPSLRKSISNLKHIPDNRVALDSIHGVLIKPAVLILRVLLQLFRKQDLTGLSVEETVVALMPTKRNDEWDLAIERLFEYRKDSNVKTDSRRKRHTQEWFRLLGLTDLFRLSKSKINQRILLSPFALNNLELVERFCEYHEQAENFWLPESDNDIQLALSWFEHYGAPNIERQWTLEIPEHTPNYIAKNYPEGVFDMEDEKQFEFGNSDISLNELREINEVGKRVNVEAIDLEKIKEGIEKRHEKTKLHDRIVNVIAEKMSSLDYQVWEDRQSVDLLAAKHKKEIIFEVKTVNKNNISRHIRLGVGQLLEYRYRREIQVTQKPKGLLVLSSKYTFPRWMIKYFETDINLGLICFEGQDKFNQVTSGKIEKQLANVA